MSKYWFRPKDYGYGYVPISVEGWIATFALIEVGIFLAYINNLFNPIKVTFQDSLFFVLEIFILGFGFLKIFEKKCKRKLKWNWGN
jgi:hypothetical protein